MSIPDVWIERVHLGEGTAAMAQAIDADPKAKAKLEALREADASFHAAFDAGEQVQSIERKLHVANTADAVAKRSRRRGWLVAVPVLAALTALIIAIPRGSEMIDTPADPGIRLKGNDKLLVYQRTKRGFENVSDGEVFFKGTELQLGYNSDATHGVLLSVDGRGAVTVHFPDDRDTAMQPGHHTLDHAYELDDAPEFERFFLVTSDRPLSLEKVVTAAKELAASKNPVRGRLEVSKQASVTDFTVKKVSP
ncbi:MAG: hypothetical protein AAGA48_23295 [Myxococcota bacterium]